MVGKHYTCWGRGICLGSLIGEAFLGKASLWADNLG